jgi:AcrR family transcriptional regulator
MARTKNWDPGLKRKKILDAAIVILNRKNYLTCPMDDIARSAGIAKGTVYLYFKSKEELYFAVMIELVSQLENIVRTVADSAMPVKEQLQLLLGHLFEFFGAHQQLFASLHQERQSMKGKFRILLHEKYHDVIAAISTIVQRGVASGELKDHPPALVGAILFSLTSVFAQGKMGNNVAKLPLSPDLILDIIMQGIERQPGKVKTYQ